MSLKAKIEAVIYASEDPVTLAQLVGLLGEEAQAELDRAESAQGSLSLNETEAELEAAAELDPALADGGEEGAEAGEAIAASDAVSTAPDAPSAAADASPAGPDASSAETLATSGLPEPSESAEPPVELPAETGTASETAEGEAAPIPEGQAAPAAPQEPDPAAVAKAERARMARLRAHFRVVLDTLIAEYATGDRGLEVREIAGGFRFATKPEYHDAVRGFVRSLKPPLKLTLQALETLAVVAYKQPVTAPEISEIRGVDSGGVLGSLIARKLITTAGRKQVIGRPILYKTTKDFLLKFGLKDLNELPSIEEFERMAGQMAEQEEIPMPDTADPRPNVEAELEQTAETVEPERDSHESQADGEVSAADDLEATPQDKASIDGRLPSLPPNYAAEDSADDPSAREAEIQNEEQGGRG